MSTEKVNRYKKQKKQRKESIKKQKRKDRLVSILCLGMVGIMLISPILIYALEFAGPEASYDSNLASGSNIVVQDEHGNPIGYVDESGNVQMYDGTQISTPSDAMTTE